jgi:hypothetical protein
MKTLLMIGTLMFTLNSFAQSTLEATSATTLSPFATATRLMETALVSSLAPFGSTIATVQRRGVAGKEQLKDELVSLNDDMLSGKVKTIDQVRQPALRELLLEIEADEAQLKSINTVITEGSKLHRIATAVTVSLLAN